MKRAQVHPQGAVLGHPRRRATPASLLLFNTGDTLRAQQFITMVCTRSQRGGTPAVFWPYATYQEPVAVGVQGLLQEVADPLRPPLLSAAERCHRQAQAWYTTGEPQEEGEMGYTKGHRGGTPRGRRRRQRKRRRRRVGLVLVGARDKGSACVVHWHTEPASPRVMQVPPSAVGLAYLQACVSTRVGQAQSRKEVAPTEGFGPFCRE